MQSAGSNGFDSIPTATGEIARLACARLGEKGLNGQVLPLRQSGFRKFHAQYRPSLNAR